MAEHNGEKVNLVTKQDRTGMYDEYRCRDCGRTGRRYGLSPTIRWKGGSVCKKAPKTETPQPAGETKPAKNETPKPQPVKGELRSLPLADLIPTPDNLRVVKADDPATVELRDNIRAVGVLQPVLARPHPKQKGKYDLRCGARRLLAARLAGLAEIPCVVAEMDDLTAKSATIIENMYRKDLAPIEEARGVRALLELGWKPADVAARFGRSPGWVLRRALLCRLTKNWQREAPNLGRWPAAWWERIAALPADVQNAMHTDWGWEAMDLQSVEELDQRILFHTHQLAQAPWRTDDPTLAPKGGACIECQKRSGVTPGLFDIPEDATPEAIKKKDRCLDKACWDKRLAAFVAARARQIQQEYGTVVEIGHGPGQTEEHQVQRCNKDDPKALPCMDEGGQLFWAKTGAKTREPKTESPSSPRGEPVRAATGDAVMRQGIANAFGVAHLARVLAGELCGPNPKMEKETRIRLSVEVAACALHVLAAQGVHHGMGAREARELLLCELNVSPKRGYCEVLSPKDLADRFPVTATLGECMMAIGLFDQAISSPYGKRWQPEIPAAVRSQAAKTFQVSAEFLACHLRVDLSAVARSLGLAANVSATKADAVKAIIDAKLPAGSLTPELAKAFGVKYAKPKAAAPARDWRP